MTESNPDKPVILIVDDSRVIRVAARKMLADDYVTIEAGDGTEAWEHIQSNDRISLVFSDLQMPQMGGLELLACIRESDDERIAALPVIIITGQEDNEAAKKNVFDHGATDFVSKPFESIDLISRAKSYTQLNRQVAELEKQVGHDKLTGLLNATSFEEQGTKSYSFAQRHKTQMSVAVLEISNFQKIFLSAGKEVAQQIIVAVCKRMTAALRTEDVAARTGMARIALMLPSAQITDARDVMARMLENLSKLSFDTGKGKLHVELACGISAVDLNVTSNFSGLLKDAESALADALCDAKTKIVLYADTGIVSEKSSGEATEQDIQQAFQHILKGSHEQISDTHLKAVVDRLRPFMQYIKSRKQ